MHSYIRGLKAISKYPCKQVTEKQVFEYDVNGKKEKQVINVGCVIPDAPDELLGKWWYMNCVLNQLYQQDTKVGDMLDVEFRKLDGEK